MSNASDGRVISDLPPGMTLCGRYLLERKLADGAAASVYVARDTQDDRRVALKILDPLRGADPVGRARFEREFQVLSSLSHDNIARCIRLETEGDLDILVLELVEGETLEALLSRGRQPVKTAVAMAITLAEALHNCHSQGVLHRDLKPANIMIHAVRGPVILDFGVAWFSSAANLTRTGAVIGTPQYLAPEVFGSSVVDARADLYSLGVILFELLTGRPVHLVQNIAELAVLHQTQDPPLVSSLRPEIPADLAQVVARAVAPRAEDRFSTAQELVHALQKRSVVMGKALQSRLPCNVCRTPLIIDLAFCPGCGADAEWSLTAGPYAVQLTEIPDIPRCMAWLKRRHAPSMKSSAMAIQGRLGHTPVPLVVGASHVTAERLASEAREAGCTAQVVRARAVIGARLKASSATITEVTVASALHMAAVSAAGAAYFLLGGTELASVVPLPVVMALLGIPAATLYVRRPLLACGDGGERITADTMSVQVRAVLATLKTDRGRRLAASAVARAAPVLLREGTLNSSIRNHVRAGLTAALTAAADLDAHANLLQSRSRTRLANEMEQLRPRAEKNDPDAIKRLAELEIERRDLVETSVAHDLAARNALEACRTITLALSGVALVESMGESPSSHG